MVSQKRRSETTRNALLDSFKNIALEQGLEAATTEAILEQTGLSKGALYHHFRSKTELVEAIYTAESHGAIRRAVGTVPANTSAIARLKMICAAWLREVQKPKVRRILFGIGPRALGTRRVIEIENSLSLKLFNDVLSEAIANGDLSLTRPDLAARLINAYVGNVALQDGVDLEAAESTIGGVIDAILEGLSG